ncbi:Hypothetical predicted protein [Mytilus galloprovincialis]|uniref:Farnesoic acid O-methyl transferase domain-containing protein n=1 Tax=Mytilus galloprovincialis TaxID=29158 RepID=A0A8B6EXN5_MYTGA|nr:Hypothetical predicted protein [Mytilus galloprovincialis]
MTEGFGYTDCIKYLNKYGHSGNSLVFKYSCDYARIYLLETTRKSSDQGIYEIVLYPQTLPEKNIVRRSKDSVINDFSSTFIPGLLERVDCPNFHPIWIAWENGFFSLGKGLSLYEDEVYNGTDPEPFVITSTGIMTSYGASGNWIIYIEGEEALELKVENVDAFKLKQLELEHELKLKEHEFKLKQAELEMKERLEIEKKEKEDEFKLKELEMKEREKIKEDELKVKELEMTERLEMEKLKT